MRPNKDTVLKKIKIKNKNLIRLRAKSAEKINAREHYSNCLIKRNLTQSFDLKEPHLEIQPRNCENDRANNFYVRKKLEIFRHY